MRRKITRNNHQYKISLPIEIIRKMQWDDNTPISVREVETPMGKGVLILEDEDKDEVLRLTG